MPEQATKPAMVPRAPTDSSESPVHQEIAALAYSLWQARGCPEGTPDEDWFNAEEALKAKAEAEA
jgi:hypothetical protein